MFWQYFSCKSKWHKILPGTTSTAVQQLPKNEYLGRIVRKKIAVAYPLTSMLSTFSP